MRSHPVMTLTNVLYLLFFFYLLLKDFYLFIYLKFFFFLFEFHNKGGSRRSRHQLRLRRLGGLPGMVGTAISRISGLGLEDRRL